MAAIPGTFMTVMTVTYILVEDKGFGLSQRMGTGIGVGVGLAVLVGFLVALRFLEPEDDSQIEPKPSELEREGDNVAC